MSSNIDPTKPGTPQAYTEDVRANFAAAKTEIDALQLAVSSALAPISQLALATTYPANGRLTLASGNPTGEGGNATVLYYTPYIGDKIALYSNNTWNTYQFSELSIAVPASVATVYDVFCYNASGTPTLEFSTAWSGPTNGRVNALSLFNGVYVKTIDPTRRYIGTIETGSSGQVNDYTLLRNIWNLYNRIPRILYIPTTAPYTYTTATWRQAGGNTSARVDYLFGLTGYDDSKFSYKAHVTQTVAAGTPQIGLTLLGTGVPSTQLQTYIPLAIGQTGTGNVFMVGSNGNYGASYVALMEIGAGAGTTSWLDGGSIFGTISA